MRARWRPPDVQICRRARRGARAAAGLVYGNSQSYSRDRPTSQYRLRPIMAAAVMWAIIRCGGEVRP